MKSAEGIRVTKSEAEIIINNSFQFPFNNGKGYAFPNLLTQEESGDLKLLPLSAVNKESSRMILEELGYNFAEIKGFDKAIYALDELLRRSGGAGFRLADFDAAKRILQDKLTIE